MNTSLPQLEQNMLFHALEPWATRRGIAQIVRDITLQVDTWSIGQVRRSGAVSMSSERRADIRRLVEVASSGVSDAEKNK